MDWFSWLSKTGLELTLVYDYGVVLACNELRAEDSAHFDHEFLKSMGINVAKHRLEMIKLARSEAAAVARSKGGVLEAIWRTKQRVVECAKKLMFHERSSKWRRGHEGGGEVFMLTHNGQWNENGEGRRSPRMKSGPLERNGQKRVVKGQSGPLDKMRGAWTPERKGGFKGKKSPVAAAPLTRPMDADDGIDSLWAKLFQDMKPT